MTVVHKEGRLHKNADGLSRWPIPNDPSNPASDNDEGATLSITGISVSNLKDELFESIMKSYEKDRNTQILHVTLYKSHKDKNLSDKLEEPWLKSYKDGRFTRFDGILYHRTKHCSCMVFIVRQHIFTVLHECHSCPYAGHLSEDRTLEKVKITAWWPGWRNDVIEYTSSCERCQKANKSTSKKFGLLQQIEEPTKP